MAVASGHGGGGGSVAHFKGGFFDAAAVLKSMDRAQAKAMSRLGAFVRQRDKSSIRYRKAPAPPGSPPSAHRTQSRLKTNRKTGVTKRQASSPLRDLIFFAYDRETQTLVVGPAVFPSAAKKGTAARIEYGGTTTGTRRVSLPGRPSRRATVTLRYEPRPHTHPAFEAELPGYFATLKDSMT